MEAGIDVQAFAGHRRGQIGQKIDRRLADFILGDVAAQRRIQLVPLQDIAEIADPAGRQGLDRPGGYGVDADVAAPQVFGQILHRRLKRGLGQTHHVVMRHHLFGPVIGQRQQAATVRHQLFGALAHGGKGIDRDVHGHAEIGGAGFDVTPAQLVLVGKADGVNHEIKAAPDFFQMGEQRIERLATGDITLDHLGRAKRGDQRLDPLPEGLALIRERQFSPLIGAGPGNAPGNRLVVGKAHDQPAFARQKSVRHWVFLAGSCYRSAGVGDPAGRIKGGGGLAASMRAG